MDGKKKLFISDKGKMINYIEVKEFTNLPIIFGKKIKFKNFFNDLKKINFPINEIKTLEERVIDDKFINFTILKDKNEINVFFDIKNFNLIGWQTLDIYQNLNITYLSVIKKNQKLEKNFFKLPSAN